MLPLTKEEIKCGKRILQKLVKNRNYQKVRHYTGKHRDATNSICHLKHNVPNENPVVFYNSSNYKFSFYFKRISK